MQQGLGREGTLEQSYLVSLLACGGNVKLRICSSGIITYTLQIPKQREALSEGRTLEVNAAVFLTSSFSGKHGVFKSWSSLPLLSSAEVHHHLPSVQLVQNQPGYPLVSGLPDF